MSDLTQESAVYKQGVGMTTNQQGLEHWVRSVDLTPPDLSDNRADADRLLAGVRKAFDAEHLSVDLELLRAIPSRLRSWKYSTRCACFRDPNGWHLVGLGPGTDGAPLVGIAVDLGTTRVVLRCLDLESGETLVERSFDNPQLEIGPDILERIHTADSEGGPQRLQQLIVDGLNREIANLCSDAGIEVTDICLIAVAGNTTMSHLLLGLDPHWIIREPYIPVANSLGLLKAKQVGLEAGIGAGVYVFPNIGSYFGGDVIAGILYAGLHTRDDPAILVDVGTNAEVVLGSREWLLACAGAAGPALEGGAATVGMMAEAGAIDRVELDAESAELTVHTIDDAPPRGICGSGLIDLAACLFRSGRLDIHGELVPNACGDCFVTMDGVNQFVVVPAEGSATSEALTLSQPEIDSLIRSKAAMFTILETIAATLGMMPEDFTTFYVAGTFGSLIDPRSAITIGMLPDLPLSKFERLGNSSLGGATLLLTSCDRVDEIETIRSSLTYLELNVNQDFMNRFSAAKFLPHTDPSRFPTVSMKR